MLTRVGTLEEIGAKAYDLVRCRLLGLNVPDFLIVPVSTYRKYDGKEIPDTLARELHNALDSLGGVVAVRSSSVSEDGMNGSMAGQFRTVLGVSSYGDIESAVLAVWDSAGGNDMAVIIQKQIDPDISGVLFTRNPVTGANETVIEYVYGLANGLVSGDTQPERVILDNSYPLQVSDYRLKKIYTISRSMEERFGYPLDIEWAFSDEAYIIQARPITALPPSGDRSYSRVQAEQFFSGPVSDLFFSVFKKIYSDLYVGETLTALGMEMNTDDIIVRHKNYIYVDTALTLHALKSAGVRNTRFLNVLPPDMRNSAGTGGLPVREVLALAGFLLKNRWAWPWNLDDYFREHTVPSIRRALNEIGEFSQMDNADLLSSYEKLIEITAEHIRVSKWGLALYTIPLTAVVESYLDRNGLGDRFTSIITGLENNRTLDASIELGRLSDIIRGNREARDIVTNDRESYAEYRKALMKIPGGEKIVDYFENILGIYGHRRLKRDILAPSWADEPMIPFSMLRTMVIQGTDGKWEKASILGDPVEDVATKLPAVERPLFRVLATYLRRYVSFREYQRFYLDLILSSVRRLFLEIGGRMARDGLLNRVEDIFFLDMSHIEDYLAGKIESNLKNICEFNRLSYYRTSEAPGKYLRGSVDFDETPVSIEAPDGCRFRGEPVSPGSYRGQIHIVENISEDSEISRDDIIVTRSIDPGQTHAFVLAGALIFETGGILSHGAILARELRLPAVAGIRNATTLFQNGQMVYVNGSTGEVLPLSDV